LKRLKYDSNADKWIKAYICIWKVKELKSLERESNQENKKSFKTKLNNEYFEWHFWMYSKISYEDFFAQMS